MRSNWSIPPTRWQETELELAPWSWQLAQLWMSRRAASPWKEPEPVSLREIEFHPDQSDREIHGRPHQRKDERKGHEAGA